MKKNIINFNKTVYRGAKSSWNKYHFLIPPKVIKKNIKYLYNILKERELPYYDPLDKNQYNAWLAKNEESTAYEILKYRPLISVLVPVYNVDAKYLKECLDSILAQEYNNFEICVVDDASTKVETIETLKEYEDNKKIKIKYRKKNGHISRATNDALKMANGEFVALMDNDDIIPKNALYEVAKALNKDKEIDMIYTDEDKIALNGVRCDPNFKSDWAPDSFMSSNYMSHFGVLRKKIVDEVGGFRIGYEGAQDYDLYLRFTEKTNKIYHIPEVLYHWRMIPGSTATEIGSKNYALEKGKKALENALKRRGIRGKVEIADKCPYYYIKYEIINNPMVSIIIPTKDAADILDKCLKSIYKNTTYKNFEVVIMDNKSEKESTFEILTRYKKKYKNFRVVEADFEFNYSKINNLGVKNTQSEIIVLLNNDIEIITPNWLEIMIGYAQQPHIGAVGAKLIYPDNTIQHGGVIMGLGIASHAFNGCNEEAVVWGGRLSVPYNYSAVTAACLMVERKKWNNVGGLEEKLRVAYNDVDFNLKLLKKGYYNVFLPMVKIYHHESKTRGLDDTPEKKVRFDWEQDFMRKKWSKEIENDKFYNPNFSRKACYMLKKNKKDE